MFFSLPAHWKATRYFLLLPKLCYSRTFYCALKWLDLRNLSPDKASEPEAWSHRPVTNGNPAALMTLLLHSGQSLNSKLEFKKSGSDLISYGEWRRSVLRPSGPLKIQKWGCPGSWGQATHLKFQREFMCYIVTDMCYYWCWANIPFYIFDTHSFCWRNVHKQCRTQNVLYILWDHSVLYIHSWWH